jgi:hypothetical protein
MLSSIVTQLLSQATYFEPIEQADGSQHALGI